MHDEQRSAQMPGVNHYTVLFAGDPNGSSLVDQAQVDRRVAQWGQWLCDLGNEPVSSARR